MSKPLLVGIIVVVCVAACALAGCKSTPKYHLSYDGLEFCYEPAEKDYAAGSTVTVVYTLIATDTDYSFYLDGEPVRTNGSSKGIEITFTMPDHDATLTCESRNTMVYRGDE